MTTLFASLPESEKANVIQTLKQNGVDVSLNPSTGEVTSGKVREAQTLEEQFWEPVFKNTDFKDFIMKQFSIGHKALVDPDAIVEEE